MPLLAYNMTTTPLPLAAGNPIVTLPASASTGARGPAINVTGELNGLSPANYAALQVQVVANSVEYEWTTVPEYPTDTLIVGSASADITDYDVNIFVDNVAGNDNAAGTATNPIATIEESARRTSFAATKKQCRVHLVTTGVPYPITTPKFIWNLPKPTGGGSEPLALLGSYAVQTDGTAVHTVTVADPTGALLTDGGMALPVNKYGMQLGALGGIVHILTGASAGQRRLIRSNTATTVTPNENLGALGIGDQFEITLPGAEITWAGDCSFVGRLQMKAIKWTAPTAPPAGTTGSWNVIDGSTVVNAEGCEFNLGTRGQVNITRGSNFTGGVDPLNTSDIFTILSQGAGVFLHEGDPVNGNNISDNSNMIGRWMFRAAEVFGFRSSVFNYTALASKNTDINLDDLCHLIHNATATLPGLIDGTGVLGQAPIVILRNCTGRLDRLAINNSPFDAIQPGKGAVLELRNVSGSGNTGAGVGLFRQGLVILRTAGGVIRATVTGTVGDIIVGGATPTPTGGTVVSYAALTGTTGFTQPLILTDAAGSSGQQFCRVSVQ